MNSVCFFLALPPPFEPSLARLRTRTGDGFWLTVKSRVWQGAKKKLLRAALAAVKSRVFLWTARKLFTGGQVLAYGRGSNLANEDHHTLPLQEEISLALAIIPDVIHCKLSGWRSGSAAQKRGKINARVLRAFGIFGSFIRCIRHRDNVSPYKSQAEDLAKT